MTGQARDDKMQAMRLELSMKDAKDRAVEAIEALHAQQQAERTLLEKRQARMATYDERRIEEAFRAGRLPGHANENRPEREKAHERHNGRGRERSHGPGR